MIKLISNLIPSSKKLMQTGEKLEATIISVKPNLLAQTGGNCCPADIPFNIYLKHEDSSGTLHSFKTSEIWDDPKPFIEKLGLETLPIFVDPKNFKRYYVDLSPLEMKNRKI